VFAFVFAAIVTVVVSLATPKPDAEIESIFEEMKRK
jgi:hypothetical protein